MRYSNDVKYYKYENADPSTAEYASIVKAEILKIIEEKINKRIREIYHLRPESVLGLDLRHAVIRVLSDDLDIEVAEIERFEKENSEDLRNYPWTESGGESYIE